jgi:hypothetical protein
MLWDGSDARNRRQNLTLRDEGVKRRAANTDILVALGA